MERKERRQCIVYIDATTILYYTLANMQRAPECLYRPKMLGIPDDCCVVAVKESFDRNAIGFLLEHPSFDVVHDGMPAPVKELVVEWELLKDAPTISGTWGKNPSPLIR